jgi:hypothetical protein
MNVFCFFSAVGTGRAPGGVIVGVRWDAWVTGADRVGAGVALGGAVGEEVTRGAPIVLARARGDGAGGRDEVALEPPTGRPPLQRGGVEVLCGGGGEEGAAVAGPSEALPHAPDSTIK